MPPLVTLTPTQSNYTVHAYMGSLAPPHQRRKTECSPPVHVTLTLCSMGKTAESGCSTAPLTTAVLERGGGGCPANEHTATG